MNTFTGTVNGKSGTLTIRVKATAEGFGMAIKGRLTILTGTGDLANLHGEGSFEGIAGAEVTYKMQIHFDPN